MTPSALLRKMPEQEQECGTAEAGRACIHLLHIARGTELTHAQLCSLVQEGKTWGTAGHLLQLLLSFLEDLEEPQDKGRKRVVERFP